MLWVITMKGMQTRLAHCPTTEKMQRRPSFLSYFWLLSKVHVTSDCYKAKQCHTTFLAQPNPTSLRGLKG